MKLCSRWLICCLLTVSLLHRGHALTGPHTPAQHLDRPTLRLRPRPVKMGEELTAKLLRLDKLSRAENDVMEPKRKRSFPGSNAPLDRLSVSSMETKAAANKQSKAVESPRRRASLPPIDRIGASRLPNSRG